MPAAKPPFPALQRGHPLAQGLVLDLPFYEGSGVTHDTSGYGTVVTQANAPWSAGPYGYNLSYNGSNSDVAVTSAPAFGPAMTILFEGALSLYSLNAMLLERESVNSTWELFFESSVLKWRGASTSERLSVSVASMGLVDGTRYQFVLVDNGGSGNPCGAIYVNAVAQAVTSAGAATVPGSNTNKIHVGNFDNSNYVWSGTIDYVAAWNRALSAAEVAALYADPFARHRRRSWRLKAAAAGPVPSGWQEAESPPLRQRLRENRNVIPY